MGGSLFSEGVVGVLLQEQLTAAREMVDKGRNFNPTLETIEDTLEALTPLVEQIKKCNREMDRPTKEVQMLENIIKAGKELVNKYSSFGRWRFHRFLCFPRYHDKLQEMDKKLAKHLSTNMQAQMARDLMETLSNVKQILATLNKEYAGPGNHGKLLRGLSGAPEKPEFTVGLDEPLRKLKIELLKRDGVSVDPVLLLTGLGGSGKSTLAKMLCRDEQVRGMFGENIFFVTVSKTPNLKTIVQKLFEHCGRRVPEFQTDEEAIDRLGLLLNQVGDGGSPILLVLDDVWPGSEALVEKFIFPNIPDYKIMVTSRVAFPRFVTQCHLKPLDHDDAVSVFRHFAKLNVVTNSYEPDENLVQELVRGCKGSPLALQVIGGSLCRQSFEVWQNMKERLNSQSILESNEDLLAPLQNGLDILEDIKEKECFMDLGLFPEDQRIRVPVLIDMWTELHELDEDGQKAMRIIHSLTTKNLANLIITRKVAKDEDMYYNNHFLMQHDLLRELAIQQSKKEPIEQRKRLMIDRPECWVGQNQQGIISRMLSFFPIRLMEQKQEQVAARVLSISTDETLTSDWCNMQPDETEVLVLNIRSSKYTLPEFTKKMSKLKVLIATNYGFHPTELNKFELLGYLPGLKRIRLENVSVPCLCKLKNLQRLSLHMCNTKPVFESSAIKISDALPNLVEMNIDYCKDLVELPSDLFNIITMKKLSITSCHKLSALPQEIENLENLELLRLSSCTELLEIPESVGRLQKLSCLDISNCVRLNQLPRDIGDLLSLKKLYMWGCPSLSGLHQLPSSVVKFQHLQHELYVTCDEDVVALWEDFTSFANLKIDTFKADYSLGWL